MSRCLRLLLLLGLLGPMASPAEEPEDAEVASLRSIYEYGRYAEVLERADLRIDQGQLTEAQLVELHKLAGLSAFHLHRTEDAARHLRALLRLEPDFNLDPFAVPPPAVDYLEGLRQQLGPELERVRQERRLRLEREKAEAERRESVEAERRESERALLEEQRRRLEALSRQVVVREVEKRSMLVNFMPFGAGQFQQGRTGLGTLFAASEGALAVTSIIAFFAYDSLVESQSVPVDDIRGTRNVPVRYIPTERIPQAQAWTWLKWGSAGGFYAVFATGVIDALWHHQDQVVQTHIETLPPPTPAPRAHLNLYPTPGGAGAGFSLAF